MSDLKYDIITDSGEDFELIFQTDDGEEVFLFRKFIVVKLPEGRNSLTTSWINGGYQENLDAIFNHQLNQQNIDDLETTSVTEFMKITAQKIGLNPQKVTGMITVASMENVAISNKKYRNIEVTAIVTAGIEVNGGRAGDPASYYEENENYEFKVGTINTILIINARLHESTLARAMMTAVEAKTVALGQLMAPSRYSNGIATGSGTDKISVISNMESDIVLTNAGKHSKLGELIGLSIIEATTEALAKQSNLTPDSQCDMLVRMERFGVDEEQYWETVKNMDIFQEEIHQNGILQKDIPQKDRFLSKLRLFSKNPVVVTMTGSILHIVDEMSWGLIPEITGRRTAISMMKTLPDILEIKKKDYSKKILDEEDSVLNNWVMIICFCTVNSC
ncbi:MAG: adenosylcobinamide amidohydrolase [Methanothermobacter sp.]